MRALGTGFFSCVSGLLLTIALLSSFIWVLGISRTVFKNASAFQCERIGSVRVAPKPCCHCCGPER